MYRKASLFMGTDPRTGFILFQRALNFKVYPLTAVVEEPEEQYMDR